jgi:hypothetical protein
MKTINNLIPMWTVIARHEAISRIIGLANVIARLLRRFAIASAPRNDEERPP